MKKLLFILPFLIFSCKKDAQIENQANLDSMMVKAPVENEVDSAAIKDSMIANSAAVEKVLDEGVNRKLNENEIIRTADGSMLPFKIGDEFKNEDQKFILKITNVDQDQLKISIDGKKQMNIRVNQIKNPDGSFDGPFAKSVDYKTSKKGEYWIILGKSQMEGSSQKGHFVLKVE